VVCAKAVAVSKRKAHRRKGTTRIITPENSPRCPETPWGRGVQSDPREKLIEGIPVFTPKSIAGANLIPE
jgi:hypothetical protein